MNSGKLVRGLLGAVTLLACGLSQAAYTINMVQSGPDVVATGSGSLNFAALAFSASGTASPEVSAATGLLIVGSTQSTFYSTGTTGPANIGGGGLVSATSSSGNQVFVFAGSNAVGAPQGYVSGTPLGTSTATWAGRTFASLGLVPGTYKWTWGTGPTADSFTVQIGPATPAAPASIPTLSEWGLIGLAGLMALFGIARMRRLQR